MNFFSYTFFMCYVALCSSIKSSKHKSSKLKLSKHKSSSSSEVSSGYEDNPYGLGSSKKLKNVNFNERHSNSSEKSSSHEEKHSDKKVRSSLSKNKPKKCLCSNSSKDSNSFVRDASGKKSKNIKNRDKFSINNEIDPLNIIRNFIAKMNLENSYFMEWFFINEVAQVEVLRMLSSFLENYKRFLEECYEYYERRPSLGFEKPYRLCKGEKPIFRQYLKENMKERKKERKKNIEKEKKNDSSDDISDEVDVTEQSTSFLDWLWSGKRSKDEKKVKKNAN